eukprot:4091519-Amphidinium_carterae.1
MLGARWVAKLGKGKMHVHTKCLQSVQLGATRRCGQDYQFQMKLQADKERHAAARAANSQLMDAAPVQVQQLKPLHPNLQQTKTPPRNQTIAAPTKTITN